ncbi:hypothetical protein HWC06_gp79 [Gordonia phage Duffington]|uniref:Uncharacterized protein n=1 Tax=Gordonia phage Duffington TaxID=2507858 RepID=A0A410TCP1_9CAUD|nr:hypothetical protein HWC06_gp79 [Gordonia phage Duffington]QAU06784.1 hypothetical protein SEA_DUFFINGTON_79 [Gordonia phage Duffington]
MEYNFKLKNETYGHVVAEGDVNSTGAHEILFRFCGLTLPERMTFMEKILDKGANEHIVKSGSVGLNAYSIAVWNEEKLEAVKSTWSTPF